MNMGVDYDLGGSGVAQAPPDEVIATRWSPANRDRTRSDERGGERGCILHSRACLPKLEGMQQHSAGNSLLHLPPDGRSLIHRVGRQW